MAAPMHRDTAREKVVKVNGRFTSTTTRLADTIVQGDRLFKVMGQETGQYHNTIAVQGVAH